MSPPWEDGFGGATLKSKGWKRGLEDGFITYTKTINGNRNVISQWPGFWQGDDGGTPTPELPTPSAVAAELEEYARIERSSNFGQAVVPHLCETQWAESDARCAQHLDDPYWSGR
jgi:hypothetical protein